MLDENNSSQLFWVNFGSLLTWETEISHISPLLLVQVRIDRRFILVAAEFCFATVIPLDIGVNIVEYNIYVAGWHDDRLEYFKDDGGAKQAVVSLEETAQFHFFIFPDQQEVG